MATQSPLALSIFNAEGGESSAGFSLNNPGDIMTNGQLNSYSTLQEGWDALESQIGKWLNGSSAYANSNTSISQLASTYTGNDNANGWANAVAGNLGLDPSATVGQAAQASPSTSLLNKVGQYLSNSGSVGQAISNAAGTASSSILGSLLTSRVVFGILGVILIAGGIFGFDKVQEVVSNTTERGATIAAAAA